MSKKFELIIYGENDEVSKTYATDIIRYGILEDALKVSEEIGNKGPTEQLKVIYPIMRRVFKGLTEEELKDADIFDVFNLFKQIINIAKGVESGGNEKN